MNQNDYKAIAEICPECKAIKYSPIKDSMRNKLLIHKLGCSIGLKKAIKRLGVKG